MTINERVSPKRLAEIIARAEVCDDSVLTDYRDIESIARELQQYRAGAEPVIPDGLHPATADLVLRFATALAEKLHKAEQKYGYSDNWQQNDWYEECLQSLWEHIKKGDPRDVAAYCAFMWHHDWATTDYDRGVQKAVDSIAAPQVTSVPQAKNLELAGWQFKSVNGDWLGLIGEHGKNQAVREGCVVREVFAMVDGINDREQVRREHAAWSESTFGNVGPIGPLKHLSKEALEAAAAPEDLSEWADMQFLLWDAQRRAGITDEQITQAMVEKLAVNKQREWPEPKDGEPRLHIAAPAAQAGQEPIYQLRDVDWYDTDKRTYDTVVNTGGAGRIVYAAPQLPQPAVVPDAIEIDDDFDSAFEHGKAVGWNAYRAAMLQGAEPVSQPYTLPEHSPCADAADHIWLQTAGEWPAPGEFSELTWSCDNQHPDDTLYVRADLVGYSPAIPDYWTGSDKANAALVMLDRIDTLDPVDDDRIEGIKRIIRELAAAPK